MIAQTNPTLFELPEPVEKPNSPADELEQFLELQRTEGLLTQTQAASVLGISRQAVKINVERGRMFLIEAMGQLYIPANCVLAYKQQRGRVHPGGKKLGLVKMF
jgi:predicted DNA-binding protein (UPF0251 family)